MTDKAKPSRFGRWVPTCFYEVDSLRPAPPAQYDRQAPLDQPAAKPSFDLLIILDDHSRLIRRVQWCFGETAEDRVQELLKRALPTMILTDNGPAVRRGRKGSGGNVRCRKNRNA